MSLQAYLARVGGDAWRSWKCLAVWPFPAVCIGYPKPKFSWIDYRNLCKVLKPGDFLLCTAERYFLSNRGIAGTAFKHLAVYVGPCSGDQDEDGFITGVKLHGHVHERAVIHAVSEGVVCQDLGDVVFHDDFVAAVRPWTTEQEQRIIIEEAAKQLGKGYNFNFTKAGPPELYCTELGEYCALRAGVIVPERIELNVDWKGIFLPLDRYKAYVTVADMFILHFPLVFRSKHADTKAFWEKSAWADDLRQKLVTGGA